MADTAKTPYTWATPYQTPQGPVTFYKEGTQIQPGTTATVTISPAARSYARLVAETYNDDPRGAVSITYVARADAPSCGYVGGFNLLNGLTHACVPLDIQIKGEAAPRHVAISIHEGVCPSQ